MFSKLANGLAGTWDSLEPQERILALYMVALAAAMILSSVTQPARARKKQAEWDALAERIAEYVRKDQSRGR